MQKTGHGQGRDSLRHLPVGVFGHGDIDKHKMWALRMLDVRALFAAHKQPHMLGVP